MGIQNYILKRVSDYREIAVLIMNQKLAKQIWCRVVVQCCLKPHSHFQMSLPLTLATQLSQNASRYTTCDTNIPPLTKHAEHDWWRVSTERTKQHYPTCSIDRQRRFLHSYILQLGNRSWRSFLDTIFNREISI